MKLPLVVRVRGNMLLLRKARMVKSNIEDVDYYLKPYIYLNRLEEHQGNGYVYYSTEPDQETFQAIADPFNYESLFLRFLFDGFHIYMFDEQTTNFFGFRTYEDIRNEYFQPFEHHSVLRPFEHQIIGANYIIKNKKALLFWETGTGKSFAALLAFDYLYHRGEVKNMLIICPNSLVLNWFENHLRKAYPQFNYGYENKSQEQITVIPIAMLNINDRLNVLNYAQNLESVVVITNYDTFSRIDDVKMKLRFDYVIYDESHFLKNNSNRTKRIKEMIDANYVVMLTGTPADGKYIDYYNQFKLCNHALPFYVQNRTLFKEKYVVPNTWRRRKSNRSGYKNTYKLLRYVNNNSFELRKEQCIDLPEKIYSRQSIMLFEEHMREYEKFVSTLTLNIEEIQTQIDSLLQKLENVADESDKEALIEQLKALTARKGKDYVASILPKILYARMLVSGVFYSGKNAKIEWLKENLQENEKYVIYCDFTHTINRIYSELREHNPDLMIERLYGDTDSERRHQIIQKFNRSDELNIIIANPKVGGIGIDLTSASVCIFYENDLSYIVRKQAEDRLHRIGQKNNVEYIDLIAVGTIDEYVYEKIQNKQEILEDIYRISSLNQLQTIMRGGSLE